MAPVQTMVTQPILLVGAFILAGLRVAVVIEHRFQHIRGGLQLVH